MKYDRFLKIFLPCLGEQGLLIFTTTITAILLGNLGNNQLIVTNMTTTIINWLQSIFTGMSLGITIAISGAYGKNDHAKIKNLFANGVYIVGGIALLTLLVSVVFQNPLTDLFYGEGITEYVGGYFIMNMIAMPATAFTAALSAAAKGVGDSVTGLLSTIVLNVINVVLIFLFCYLKVFGSSLGMLTGAGIATIASRYLSAIFSWVWLRLKHKEILPQRGDYKPDKDSLKLLCKFGIPTALEYFIFRFALLVHQEILVPLGNEVQGGYQIGMRVLDVASAFATAMQMTAVIVIAQELGKGEKGEVKDGVKLLTGTSYVLFLVLGAFIFAFAPQLVSLFTVDRQALYASAIEFSRNIAILSLFFGVFMTYAGILRGAGDNKFITVITNVATWLGRILVSVILLSFGLDGCTSLCIGLGVDFGMRAVAYILRLQYKQKNMIKTAQGDENNETDHATV